MNSPAHPRFGRIGSAVRLSLLALSCVASLQAQSTVTFGSISDTPTDVSGDLGDYQATIGGTVRNDLTFPAYNVTVTGGTDVGEILIGQNFLAICVNISYPGLTAGTFLLSSNGTSLSYDIDGDGATFGESWGTTPQQGKYNAIRDIVAAFGSGLAGMDQNSLDPLIRADFQYRITALNFALAEISVDGISDIDPLTTGDMQFRNGNGTDLADPVLDYFNTYMAAIGTVDNNDIVLYSAGVAGYLNQDVILIPIPEPGVAVLAGAAGLFGLVRRRRI